MRVSSWLYLFEQTACSLCLLSSIGLCAGLRLRSLWRMLLTALMLSILAMAGQTGIGLRLLLLPLSALSPLLAWPDVPRRFRLRMVVTGALLSLWLTGFLRFISPAALPGALLLLAGCAALSVFPRAVSRRGAAPPTTAVEVHVGPRQLTLTALVDSGNLLRDAITGLPVIVISQRAAVRLLPALPERTNPDALRALLPGMRLMPVRTVSGTAMMTVLRPDCIRILTGASWQTAAALIGLSPDGYEGFQALLPASLLRCAPETAHQTAIS